MRPRRYLLVTTALGSATLIGACRKDALPEPPPGNPKGVVYDAGTPPPLPPPGNPKGSAYDDGAAIPGAADGGADASPTLPTGERTTPDAGKKNPPPPDTRPDPGPNRLPPGNPKGSHYDAGSKLPKK